MIDTITVSRSESNKDRYFNACFPGKYIQGEYALNKLSFLVNLLATKALVIASPTVAKSILPKYDFFKEELFHIEKFHGECCEPELFRFAEIVYREKIDIIIGMGGGKTIDTAKIVSDRAGIPVIIVPTIASSDAPCSGCAVIYTEDGIFDSVYYQRMNPEVILVDITLIAEAPVRYLIAGMGDALATWFEARSCERTQSVNECGGYSTMTAIMLAKLCYDTLLKYGQQAIIACQNNVITPALHHIVEANTLLSGIGFESAGLAAAHSIHNGLTALPETNAMLHGEKVAFGVLTSLHLTDADPREIEEVYTFCEDIGLPTTLKDIGIEDANPNRLMDAAIKATAEIESIHKEAGIITPEKVLNAIIAADAMGSARKQ